MSQADVVALLEDGIPRTAVEIAAEICGDERTIRNNVYRAKRAGWIREVCVRDHVNGHGAKQPVYGLAKPKK